MIKQLSKSVREYKPYVIITLVFIIGEVFLEVLIPFITANLVNGIKASSPISDVVAIGIKLVVMAFLSLCCGVIAGFSCSRASAGFAKNLRHDIFEKIQSFSFENIDHFSEASLVTRMTTDVSNVQMAFMMLIRTAIRCPLMIVFSVVMAFKMGGSLALTLVVVIPILAFGIYLIAKNAIPSFRTLFKKYDAMNESVEENVRAMRDVKGYAREPYEKDKFNRASTALMKDFTKAERLIALIGPLMSLCMYVNMVFVYTYGSKLIISSRGQVIDVGQMSAMTSYGMQVLMSLMMVAAIYVMLTMSTESARRICEVLNEEPTIVNPENPVMDVADGSIVFEDVKFKYSQSASNYSLTDISFEVASGMTVGILGNTGSGKTSLVSLIPRIYDATEGAVKVGGVNVKDYDLDTLRNSVSVVLQKSLLFSGTILDNLRWGNPDATQAQVEEACRLSHADEFIAQFPDKYETKIEQGGTNVSGGQRQRLCIARALLKKPKVLIMDDSTSAVDMKTDAQIRGSFRNYIPETTKIIIAQRVASVKDADLILVMENGHILASGKHDDLFESCELYRDIYEQQTSGGDFDV